MQAKHYPNGKVGVAETGMEEESCGSGNRGGRCRSLTKLSPGQESRAWISVR